MKKSIFASKTMWLNLIVAIVAILAFVNPELLTAIGVEEARQKDVLTLVGTVTALLNLVLRAITNKGLTINSNEAE
jgi:uncharacterized membrane protein